MHTRSKGDQNLIPYTPDINLFSRPTYRKNLLEFVRQNKMGDREGEVQIVEEPARLIGAGDAPNIYETRFGIAAPEIERDSFDVKSNLLQAVQNNQYNGLPLENPFGHLSQFTRLCGLTKVKGVSEDALKLRLFPFSLGGAAAQWERELPPGSITTWDQCRKAFLAKFFTPNRTAKIRTQISSFAQGSNESFSEAWERFKRYQSDCPHHNFEKDTLLSTFYRGLTHENRRVLDTASQGNFLTNTVEDGWELIENMANADSTYGADTDRTIRAPIREDLSRNKELKALSDKLDRLILEQQKTKDVNMVGELEDFDQEQLEEVSYMQNNGNFRAQQQPYYNQYKPHPNLSYRNPNVANPQDQSYPTQNQSYPPRNFAPRPPGNTNFRPFQPQATQQQQPANTPPEVTTILNQILKGQSDHSTELAAFKTEVHRKIDASHAELSSRLEQLTSRVQFLEGHHDSTSNVKVSGQLPGKAIMNPKEFNVSCISMCSANDTPMVFDKDTTAGDSTDQKRGAEQIAAEIRNREDPQNKPALGSSTRQNIYRVTVVKPSSIPRKTDPFPEKFRKGCLDKYKDLFHRQTQNQDFRVSIIDTLATIPKYLKFLKDIISHKKKESTGVKVDTYECNTLMHIRSTLEKLEDPGTFTLPCSINDSEFTNCLCDLGASISLMPLSVANRLGLLKYKRSKISLVLADRSVMTPHGLLEDVPVRIGKVIVPTDFVVVDMETEPKDPLLFGRPFLASAGALIDVKSGTIELNLGRYKRLTFDIDGTERKPKIAGQTFSVEGIDQEEIEHPKCSKVHLVKCSKPSDYQPREPFYEVIDGESLETLFSNTMAQTVEFKKKKSQNKKLQDKKMEVELKPIGQTGNTMEYRVIGGRQTKPSKTSPLLPGSFSIKEIKSCGTVTISGDNFANLPFNGQKVRLYLADSEREVKTPDLGPELKLKPTKVVDGALEYKIKSKGFSKPFAKIRQLLTRSKTESDWSGPFAIKDVNSDGKITLVGLKGKELPTDGQKVQIYLATGEIPNPHHPKPE